MRLIKWLVIVALLILILMALFLPDRGLACAAKHLLTGAGCGAATATSQSPES